MARRSNGTGLSVGVLVCALVGCTMILGCGKDEQPKAGILLSTESMESEAAHDVNESSEEAVAPVTKNTDTMLDKISEYYGVYHRTEDLEEESEKLKKHNMKIYYFELLENGQFYCNESNFQAKRKKFSYYVTEADLNGFSIAFENVSASRFLKFSYDSDDALSLEEGKAPGECGWSLSGWGWSDATWKRTRDAEGESPTLRTVAFNKEEGSGERTRSDLRAAEAFPRGNLMIRGLRFVKKLGFSEADDGEKFGVLSFEIRNTSSDPIDFEMSYSSCEDFVQYTCDKGGEIGDVMACERPHFGDGLSNGLLLPNRSVKMNCCRTFEEGSECTAIVDASGLGGGVHEVKLY